MIDMSVAIEQQLDVLEAEAELADAVADHRDRVDEPTVDHDMPFGRRDQVRGDVRSPDVIEIPDDAERRERAVHHPEGVLDPRFRESLGRLLQPGGGVLCRGSGRRKSSGQSDGKHRDRIRPHDRFPRLQEQLFTYILDRIRPSFP